MHWFTAASRILLIIAVGGLLGWLYDRPILGMAIASAGVILVWSHQQWQLQRWMADSDKPPPDLYGVWGDIVARVYKTQREASAEQARLQSTVDYLLESFASMRDGVVIVEGPGGIRWCNEAAQKLLKLRYPDDIGQAITNLVREPDFNEYIHAGDYAEPLLFQTGDERKLHLQLIITRFADDDTLFFIRDISDRVRTERMRRDFVGNVSHELRTPLTVITGYLGTILSNPDSLPAPYVKPLQQMEQQAERMENLLKDLLWLSRIESEERQEKRELVNVGALLEELREELASTHPENQLTLELGCEHKVYGDYRELHSAVSNLVLNAFKYSPQDSPVIATWQKQGEDYQLAIRDRGIGIESSHFSRLTERFYRVDDSRSSATGGTGLGLAIVKHVAAAHGARLEIDSQLGRGSTFSLVFPENT